MQKGNHLICGMPYNAKEWEPSYTRQKGIILLCCLPYRARKGNRLICVMPYNAKGEPSYISYALQGNRGTILCVMPYNAKEGEPSYMWFTFYTSKYGIIQTICGTILCISNAATVQCNVLDHVLCDLTNCINRDIWNVLPA